MVCDCAQVFSVDGENGWIACMRVEVVRVFRVDWRLLEFWVLSGFWGLLEFLELHMVGLLLAWNAALYTAQFRVKLAALAEAEEYSLLGQ